MSGIPAIRLDDALDLTIALFHLAWIVPVLISFSRGGRHLARIAEGKANVRRGASRLGGAIRRRAGRRRGR